MKKGKLLVIEGLDGSGKATQTELLYETLKKMEKDVCRISFPNYDEPSSALVKMFLNSEFGPSHESVNIYAVSSFFAVDRYASYIRFWKDIYDNGGIIVADRYTTSNIIYQLGRLKKENWDSYIDWIYDYEYDKLGLPSPDLVLYLDMPVEVSQRFIEKRYAGNENLKDIYERDVKFLEACRGSAIYATKKLNWQRVECCCKDKPKSISEIQNQILKTVIERIL